VTAPRVGPPRPINASTVSGVRRSAIHRAAVLVETVQRAAASRTVRPCRAAEARPRRGRTRIISLKSRAWAVDGDTLVARSLSNGAIHLSNVSRTDKSLREQGRIPEHDNLTYRCYFPGVASRCHLSPRRCWFMSILHRTVRSKSSRTWIRWRQPGACTSRRSLGRRSAHDAEVSTEEQANNELGAT
jgi:hypothetical protein